MSRRNLLLKMELRSNPETLCAVRGAVAQLTERLGFSESECRAAVLGIDEALTNIFVARMPAPDRPIGMQFRHTDTFVRKNGKTKSCWRIAAESRPQKMCGRAGT